MNEIEQKRLIAALTHKILAQIHYSESSIEREGEVVDVSYKGGKSIEFGIEVGADVLIMVTSIMKLIEKLNHTDLVIDGQKLSFEEKAKNIYLSSLVSTLYEFAFKLAVAVVPSNVEKFSVKDKKDGGWNCDFSVEDVHNFNIECMALSPVLTMALSSKVATRDQKNKLIDDIRQVIQEFGETIMPKGGLKQIIQESHLTNVKKSGFLDIYNGKERTPKNDDKNIIDLLNSLP